MATNVDENCKKDTEETNLRPIKLNKTTNITKIKGWRNKKFNLEISDNADSDLGSISTTSVLNKNDCVDSELDSKLTTSVNLIDVSKSGKFRNSELLDCLVQKIGDLNDNSFGNTYISSKTDDLKFARKEMMRDSACFNFSTSSCVSEAKEKLDIVSSNLPEATKSAAFLKSAFISESLDNFLSGVMKVNNIHEDTSAVNVTNFFPIKTEVVKPDEPKSFNSVKVVDEYGKKPRTLAEKRRILERVGYPNKMLKLDNKDFEHNSSDKHFSNHLNEDDNFRRKDEHNPSERVLRSSYSNSGDVSSFNIKQVPRNDGSLEESVSVDNLPNKNQLKGKSLVKNLFKLRREAHRRNQRMNKKIKRKFREKLKNLKKTSKINKTLSEKVYIKPLKKRIFIDFMPLLKEHEIVTRDDHEFTESVRMVMFLGIGRCLYEEQVENLDLLRNNSCFINENFARFATSTILDRKRPKKIVRILTPVVSTKLLTFMKRYNLIKERYNEFLVNKFNIDVTMSTYQPAQSRTQVSVQNFNDFQEEEELNLNDNSVVKSSDPVDTTSRSKCDKQTNPSKCEKSKCSVKKEVIADIKQIETTCDQVPDVGCNSSDNSSSPNCKVKFKKKVIKNGRIFHEDKRITKLNYELRRLNHAFVEIEGESDANILNSSNEKDMTKLLLPDDIIPNKLAKVESEFHQTIMKSKGDFVFVSSCGERARRNRKLPKKLEDTIMLSELGVTSKLFEFEDSIQSPPKEPAKVSRNLRSNVQLEFSKQSSPGEPDDLKPLEKKFEACKSGETNKVIEKDISPNNASTCHSPLEQKFEASKAGETKYKEVVKEEICSNNGSSCHTPLEQNLKACKAEEKRSNEVIGKELVIVQTAQSILKKNVFHDGANSINKSNSNSSSSFEESKAQDNIKKLESVDGGLKPVVLLKRITCRDPMRIWCLDHSKYDCLCLSDKASHRVRNVAVKRTNPNYSYKLDFMSIYREFVKQGYSKNKGKIEFGTKDNKEVDVVPVAEQKSEVEGNIDGIPRIENIMSLKPEDFFKDDCSNSSGTEDSGANQSTSISQNEEKFLQVVPRIQLSGLQLNSKATLKKSLLRSLVNNNFRFFCVLLNYPFSYIKFWIGPEWKSHFKEQLLANSIKKNSNLFILIPFNFICNMIREAIEKDQCVFQSLMKSSYNPLHFNNLPFGIYAASKNMVLFGPYAASEAHRLQAYKFYDKCLEEDPSESSQAKQIPFVNPEYRKQFEEIDYTYGYWWNIVNNKPTTNQAVYKAITSKRLSRPVMNASIVVPVIVPLKKDGKSLEDSNKELIKGTLDSDKQNSNFLSIEDMLLSSESKKIKLANKNNLDIAKIDSSNFNETAIMTIKNINQDSLNDEDPSSCNSQINDDKYLDISRNRLDTQGNNDSDIPVKCKKSPVIMVKKHHLLSVVHPQDKNGEKISDNYVTMSHSKVQQLIQELGGSMSNEDAKISVQPNGLRNPVPLCKLKQIGNTSYYCLKNNRKHIFKIKNTNRKMADKNTILLCSKISGQNSAGTVNADVMNDDSNMSNLNFSRQLQKTVENETYVDYISDDNILDKSDALDKDGVSITDLQLQSASVLPKMQISDRERKNSASNLSNGSMFRISSNTSSAKCDELPTKKMCSNASVTKLNLEKYRTEMKNSHGFIPITSDLLRKNVGLSKCNVKLLEKPVHKIVYSNGKISSLLKVKPNETADKRSEIKVYDAGCETANNESSNSTKDQPSEIATNNEDILLGFSKSIESIERMKSSGINSAKGVLLKVKFKDDPQLFKLNVNKCSDTAEVVPKENNKNPVERCNPHSEQALVPNNTNDSYDFSLSKDVTDIQRKRIVNRYDSPHCSDEILLINDRQGNSSASNCSDFIDIGDSFNINTVIDRDRTGLRIVNDENNPLAYLTSTCDYTSSLSLSVNNMPIDGTFTPFPPKEKSIVIQSVSEPKNTPSSPPLLKRTMMKLVKEAKSVSKKTSNTTQDTIVGEELKLVSNLDSLPNFLESYGIHFTDDDI